MLDVILGEDIHNVAVVVTRYFGGVLLGTGGLVRAYSRAVQEGLAASRIIEKKKGICLRVTTDYTGVGKLQYIAGERSLPVLNSEYTDRVILELLIPFRMWMRYRKPLRKAQTEEQKWKKTEKCILQFWMGKC